MLVTCVLWELQDSRRTPDSGETGEIEGDYMKKEIIVCDKCGREINKGEQYVQLHSNKVQDICRDCAYSMIGNKTYVANTGDKYKPLFWKAANEEFWNIL